MKVDEEKENMTLEIYLHAMVGVQPPKTMLV